MSMKAKWGHSINHKMQACNFRNVAAANYPRSIFASVGQPKDAIQKPNGAAVAACLAGLGFSIGLQFAQVCSSNAQADSRYQYEEFVQKKARKSLFPTSLEARALSAVEKDMFTEDAWKGMVMLVKYAEYLENEVYQKEEQSGCELCEKNRRTLEKAWQVVSTEFYDSKGQFRQEDWVNTLLDTLQENNGVLRTKGELYKAMAGMVDSLGDRYSEYLTPAKFRRAVFRPKPVEKSYFESQLSGVGIRLGPRNSVGDFLVEAVYPGSPAEEAGIKPSMHIAELDGMPASQLTRDSALALLRGPYGSHVSVTLSIPQLRASPTSRTVDVEKRSLLQPSYVAGRLPAPSGGEVVYIRITFFGGETTDGVLEELKKAQRDGALGVIMDIRNCPGGVFEEAIALAGFFLPEPAQITGVVREEGVMDAVYRVGHLSPTVFPKSQQPGPVTQLPVALLTNGGSASASEVLAGALHDNQRAVMIGEPTFGKGLVQYFFPIVDGGGLKLTVEKYITPVGLDISQQGGLGVDIPCSDYPHGPVLEGNLDRGVLTALDWIDQAENFPPALDVFQRRPV